MTKGREGWKEDVTSLHRLFLSLRISVQHMFDPDKQTLRQQLSAFAKDKANDEVDCTLVVFMGHGLGQGSNCFLQTKDELFEIWSNCSQIFCSSVCNLLQKPKMFFVQMCRTEKEVNTSMAQAANVENYVLVFASQPGEAALRDTKGPQKGSHFIQKLTDIMQLDACCAHVESIIKQVQKVFQRNGSMQAPQLVSTVTARTDTNDMKSSIVGQDLTIKKQPTETDSKAVSGGTKHPAHLGSKPSLNITITTEVKPNSPEIQRDAEYHIKSKINSDSSAFSSYISTELNIDAQLSKVSTGSITLQFIMDDLRKVEVINHMCQTGVFENILETYFVTSELLQKCKAEKVMLKAAIEERSFKLITDYLHETEQNMTPIQNLLEDITTTMDEDIVISTLTNDEHPQWLKNKAELVPDWRIRVGFWAGRAEVNIRQLRVEDSGLYTCEHRAPNSSQLMISKCRLTVNGFTRPRDVQVDVVNSFVITVRWSAAKGVYSGYRVYCSPKVNPGLVEQYVQTPQDMKCASVSGLTPGETYRVCVVTFNEDEESDGTPAGGLTVTLPGIHYMVLEQGASLLQSGLDLEVIIAEMKSRGLFSESEVMLIQSKHRTRDQINALNNILKGKTANAFQELLHILQKSGYQGIAEKFLQNYVYLNKGISTVEQQNTGTEEPLQKLAWHEDDDEGTLIQSFPPYQQTKEIRVSQFVSSLTPTGHYAESISSFVPTDTDSVFTGDTSSTSKTIFGTVIHDHKPEDDSELHLQKGDVIIISDTEGDLWRGQIGGQTGLFPPDCVQVHGASGQNISADEEVKSLIAGLHERESHQTQVEDEASKLRERILQLSIGARKYVDEKLEVFFSKRQQLGIQKRDKTQPGRPELAADRWRAVTHTLLPQHVLCVIIDYVNLGQATQGVLDFVATCTELNVLALYNVGDGTINNQYILGGLRNALNKLTKVVWLDIRDTPLGGEWGDVLSSLAGPQLRLLSLIRNKLGGCGEQVAACLARLPLLLELDLTEFGLSGEGLVAVLTSLPHCCPHLVVLFLGGNDLSDMEDLLVQVVEKLPKLRIMGVGNCKIKSQFFSSILDKAKNIELFGIESNVPLLHLPSQEQTFVSLVEQRTTLRYLAVTTEQLSPGARERLGGLLRGRGGGLVVGGAQDPGLQQCVAYIHKIRDECLKKFI